MSLTDAVRFLAKNKISLWIEQESLRYHAPKGIMDETARSLLKIHRKELFSIVNKHNPQRCLIGPATLNQSSLWFLQKFVPDTASYNVAVSFRLCNRIDIQAFSAAFRFICLLHPQLCSSFYLLHDQNSHSRVLCQIVKESLEYPVDYVKETQTNNAELERLVIADYRRPFNLEDGPLIRCSVYNADQNNPVILLSMHHIIVDAWSLRILIKNLFKTYRDAILGNLIPIIDGPVGARCEYFDFSLKQNLFVNSDASFEHRQFFINNLIPAKYTLNLKTDFPRPRITRMQGASIQFSMDSTLFRQSVDLVKKQEVSINTLLLTVYACMLALESKSPRFNIGVPTANRDNVETFDTVGYFVNTIAIPFIIDLDASFSSLLKYTHNIFLNAFKFQELPFASVVDALNPPRDISKAPVFQVLFNFLSHSLLGKASELLYNGSDSQLLNIEDVECQPYPIAQQEGQFDITFEVIERGDVISGQLKYNTALFSEKTAHRFLDNYITILKTVVRNDTIPIGKIEVVGRQNQPVLAFAGTFTAEPLKDPLDFWIDRLHMDFDVEFAGYNQVLQQLLDPMSLFRHNTSGINVVLLRIDDWIQESAGEVINNSIDTVITQLSYRFEEFIDACSTASGNNNSTFFVFFCPPSPELFGNLSISQEITEIQSHWTSQLNELSGIYATDSETILKWYPVSDYHDPIRLTHGHIPYTSDFFTILSSAIIRRIFVLRQKPIKVIASDCDGTLWNGIVAEDGAAGVNVDEGFREFQELLLQQRMEGRLVSLLSKNDEQDIFSALSLNKSMILQQNHIFSSRINWLLKSENLRSLADEINIGLDGFLFIDDNPVECAEVSNTLPEVMVIQFPGSSSSIHDFINGLWMLDTLKITDEDDKRNEYYKTEKQRKNIREQTRTLTDFLDKLELVVEFDEQNGENIERLSQLSFRTNQFNMTSVKYTVQELGLLIKKEYIIRSIAVEDRFGDYGIVGLMVAYVEEHVFHVDSFLLSCRVLGRGVEYRMVHELAQIAVSYNAKHICIHAQDSNRNKPALIFLENLESQCSNSYRKNLDCIILADEAAKITLTQEPASTSEKQRSTDVTFIREGRSDIIARNNIYFDISKNLSSVESIIKAFSEFQKKKIGKMDILLSNKRIQQSGKELSSFELSVSEIWKHILHLDHIDSNINFFDAGGTSLQLPDVLVSINNVFGVELSLIDLFKYTTIQQQAEVINTGSTSTAKFIHSSGADRHSALQKIRERTRSNNSTRH